MTVHEQVASSGVLSRLLLGARVAKREQNLALVGFGEVELVRVVRLAHLVHGELRGSFLRRPALVELRDEPAPARHHLGLHGGDVVAEQTRGEAVLPRGEQDAVEGRDVLHVPAARASGVAVAARAVVRRGRARERARAVKRRLAGAVALGRQVGDAQIVERPERTHLLHRLDGGAARRGAQRGQRRSGRAHAAHQAGFRVVLVLVQLVDAHHRGHSLDRERHRRSSSRSVADGVPAREEGEALFSSLERPEVRRDADNGACVRCRRFSRASPSREVHDVVR
mmetsp:Transcript_8864/g.37509  ORF Transcript_8864/g.37509 Transcript_8864/m.37509 type:complete len:282 (-) Transcript_8864:355-1200(-)